MVGVSLTLGIGGAGSTRSGLGVSGAAHFPFAILVVVVSSGIAVVLRLLPGHNLSLLRKYVSVCVSVCVCVCVHVCMCV